MNIQTWTKRAQRALQDGRALAIESGHGSWTAAHVLLAALEQEGGLSEGLLRAAGVDLSL